MRLTAASLGVGLLVLLALSSAEELVAPTDEPSVEDDFSIVPRFGVSRGHIAAFNEVPRSLVPSSPCHHHQLTLLPVRSSSPRCALSGVRSARSATPSCSIQPQGIAC